MTTTATSYHQTKGHAPATTHESGMTIKEEEERTAATTKIIKPDPDQSTAAIPTTTNTTTPKNNKKPKKANPKSSSVDDVTENGGSDNNKKTKVSSLPMPTSWAEAGVADRMLLSMRDSGEDWAKIRKQWNEVTGSDTAASTLPTRYSRLKASMTVLEDGDVSYSPIYHTTAKICRPELEMCVFFFLFQKISFRSPWPGKVFFFILFFYFASFSFPARVLSYKHKAFISFFPPKI